MGPVLKLVQVPLDGIASLRQINRITQLGVISKVAESALSSSIYDVNQDINNYDPHVDPLSIHNFSPVFIQTWGHWSIHMDVTIQAIPYPTNIPTTKSRSLQFREKGDEGDCVKGLTDIKIDDIHRPSLVHSLNHSIEDGH
ncbi:testosterone 17-beta-dehydrogenase 3-like [Willisornis vidua]|uniref:Testosterone 17-beta-dehydrogenase 3-like n=1 Tax=Willisornis vidua TaxID=1566151 RepID=A0ABQ9CN27_9PASS|nr:testosterone 17-beta-dehydrogenase 3-like [Willisornis vidua]